MAKMFPKTFPEDSSSSGERKVFEYFKDEAESDDVETALRELGENDYTEEEIRLVRIKFLSEMGN